MSSTKKIAFIANYQKTYFYDAIAQKLRNSEYEIFWFSVDTRLTQFLKEEYGSDKVLDISRSLSAHKVNSSNIKIYEILHIDRVLSLYSNDDEEYLLRLEYHVRKFLHINQISYVFGELTWAHELIIFDIVEELDACEFLNPHTVRIPNKRFGFFSDRFQSNLKKSTQSRINVSEIFNIEAPDYLELNNTLIKKK
jgi:hypothetical protein